MKTLAYYISDYGYGHATRSLAIIRQLLKKNNDVKIIICNSYALDYMRAALEKENLVSFRNVPTDIGYVLKSQSMDIDIEIMKIKYQKYLKQWDYLIEQEKFFIQENKVDFIISDITPIPFEAAFKLGIPSLGISNFTWFTAYQDVIEKQLLEPFKGAYNKMTYYFKLAGSKEPNWANKENRKYEFFSREIDWDEVNRIKNLIDHTNGNRHVIYFGLGMKVDIGSLDDLPLWDSPDCIFIVSSNVTVNKPNVYTIPHDYLESQNFIAASDLVISKAGWSTVAEAVCARKPLLLLDRQNMKEDQNTISFLKKHHLCKTITWQDLKEFKIDEDFMRKATDEYISKDKIFQNKIEDIAENIWELI